MEREKGATQVLPAAWGTHSQLLGVLIATGCHLCPSLVIALSQKELPSQGYVPITGAAHIQHLVD